MEPIKNNALVRLHNTRTPARFEPIKNNALVRFHNSNTQTPARFEPMLRKKHADRMLHVTFGTYNPLKSARNIQKNYKKQSLGPVPEHPNAVDSERWLLKVSSASDSKRPKHQQDSSPCQAKNTQTECFTSPLEPIKNNNKKQSFGSETPERQQQSSLCQAKNRSKRTYNHKQERGFRTMAAQSLVSVRFEKTETPARFEPMPSKKHADRMLCFTSPLEPIRKNKYI